MKEFDKFSILPVVANMVFNCVGWPSITKYDWAIDQNVGAAPSYKDEIYVL